MPKPTNRRPAALVTGAANRIGAEIARALAGAGYAIVVHHRGGAAEAAALVGEIRGQGGEAAALKADLAVRRQRAGVIARAVAFFGPLTVLVNNASSFEPDTATDLDEALWDRHFAIHLEAPAFLSRDFARQLPPRARGNIINIIDERVLHLSPANFSYTLSKAGLWTITQTMAQSLAPRIRVNAIAPGATLQEKEQSMSAFQRAHADAPLGYGATASDITEAVLYLLKARAVTGQMIAIDGGKHLEFPASRDITPRRPPS
jgi:NAD(P)-dependent dehydrogenase (short-subunit alcohol dehydrogenase family)